VSASADEQHQPPRRKLRPIDEAYRSDRTLADGTRVRLRLLRPDDRDGLARGFEQLSAESRYRRFFSAMPRLPATLLDQLTATDNRDHLAVIAQRVDADGVAHEGLGVARFVRLKDAADTAEAAVAVIDRVHRQGAGTILLSVLTRAARERGITKFRCFVQADNEGSKGLLHALAEHPDVRFDHGSLVYEVDLPKEPVEETRDSALYRLLRFAAEELRVVFRAVTGEAHAERTRDGD
jgi:GNAT superfamily N-acetyltransferase